MPVRRNRALTTPAARRFVRAGLAHGRKRAAALKAARRRGPAAAPRGSSGLLVAEGDSWFDYPLFNVLGQLEDHHGFRVESVAHNGDTVESIRAPGLTLWRGRA